MPDVPTVRWCGVRFWVYPVDDDLRWSEEPGRYLFVAAKGARWVPLYVGQAQSLANRLRLRSHEKWAKAARLGATHIHVCTLDSADDLDRIECEIWKNHRKALVLNELAPPGCRRHQERLREARGAGFPWS